MKNSIFFLVLYLFSCNGEDDTPRTIEKRKDNGVTLNIPLTGSLQNAAFSPDGQSIVFTRFINGYNKAPAELYKFNLGTEKLTLLVSEGSGNVNLPGAAWNNGKIVFSSSRDPHDEVYLITEGGSSGDEVQITGRPNHVAYEPTLSPNGEWTVFESHVLDVETDGIIMKYKIDGSSEYIALTAQGDDCRQPNWSPSDNKILYQRAVGEVWNIWIMNVDGTNRQQVTANLGSCTDASFSNDGQFIVFSTDFEVEIANIYRIDIAGSNPKRLTNYNGYDGAPSISPDGKKLIFESTDGDPDVSSGTKLVLLNL